MTDLITPGEQKLCAWVSGVLLGWLLHMVWTWITTTFTITRK